MSILDSEIKSMARFLWSEHDQPCFDVLQYTGVGPSTERYKYECGKDWALLVDVKYGKILDAVQGDKQFLLDSLRRRVEVKLLGDNIFAEVIKESEEMKETHEKMVRKYKERQEYMEEQGNKRLTPSDIKKWERAWDDKNNE